MTMVTSRKTEFTFFLHWPYLERFPIHFSVRFPLRLKWK